MADFYLVSRKLEAEKSYAPRACQILRWLHRKIQHELVAEFALVSVHPPIPKEVYGTDDDLRELMLEAEAKGTSLHTLGKRPVYVSICDLAFKEDPIPDNVAQNWKLLGSGLVYRMEAAASVLRPKRLDEREVEELVALHELWLDSFGKSFGEWGKRGQQLWLEDADLAGIDLSGRNLMNCVLQGVNLDGANLAGANLNDAVLNGASLRHADLRRTTMYKANLENVQADHIQLMEAKLTRCELNDADLRGASLDHAVLIKTFMHRAGLRGGSMRFAKLDRCWIEDAVLGPLYATGASGTIMPGTFIWEGDGQRQTLDTDQLIAALRAAGSGEITAFVLRP